MPSVEMKLTAPPYFRKFFSLFCSKIKSPLFFHQNHSKEEISFISTDMVICTEKSEMWYHKTYCRPVTLSHNRFGKRWWFPNFKFIFKITKNLLFDMWFDTFYCGYFKFTFSQEKRRHISAIWNNIVPSFFKILEFPIWF